MPNIGPISRQLLLPSGTLHVARRFRGHMPCGERGAARLLGTRRFAAGLPGRMLCGAQGAAERPGPLG